MSLELPIYTIYDHPSDYPEHFVVRKCTVTDGAVIMDEKLHLQSNSIEMIHRILQSEGLIFMPRSKNDDAVIIGNYI